MNMAEQLVRMTREFAEMDFADMPGAVFMGLLRRGLVDKGFSVADAEAIVSGMEIALPPGSVTQEQVEELAANYTTVLVKLRDTFTNQGFEEPALALRGATRAMSLKLST